MHEQGFFYQAFVYLSAAVLAVPVAKRLGLGSVLGYLVAGVLIGPHAFGLIGGAGQDVMHFAEFGVVMMLFLIGLEIQPALLWRLRGSLLGLGSGQLVGTAVVVAGMGLVAGVTWQASVAVGLIVAMSSTAIVLQTLKEKNQLRTDAGQAAFAVLLFQDLAVIPLLALLPLLAVAAPTAVGHAGPQTWAESLSPWAHAGVVLGTVGGIVVAGRLVTRWGLRVIARTGLRELFTAASLLLVIGIALLMEQIGLSPALGAFVAGVVLANSEYRHELETDIEPFKGLLLGLFFIAVGAAIDVPLVVGAPLPIAGAVVALVLVKAGVLLAISRLARMSLEQGLLLALALAQGGEFAFVLISFATTHQVLTAALAAPLVAVVALSMAATPLVLLLYERLLRSRFGVSEHPARPADAIDAHHPVIIAGFGQFGNTVGRLLSANGIQATVLDVDSDHVEALRRLGFRVFYGDASRADLLRAAGAADARFLVVAVDDPDKAREIIAAARDHFPKLMIMARAVGRTHAYELVNLGLSGVFRDTFDSSLRLGGDLLHRLGLRAHQAERAVKTFRRHDEEHLRELAAVHGNQQEYLNLARQRIHDLEEVLLADRRRGVNDSDDAWDSAPLVAEFGHQAEGGRTASPPATDTTAPEAP